MAGRDITASGSRATDGRPRLEAVSPRYGEKAIFALLALCAAISVATTLAIVISLIVPSIGFFSEVPFADFLFGTDWAPTFADATFGVLPIVALGTPAQQIGNRHKRLATGNGLQNFSLEAQQQTGIARNHRGASTQTNSLSRVNESGVLKMDWIAGTGTRRR